MESSFVLGLESGVEVGFPAPSIESALRGARDGDAIVLSGDCTEAVLALQDPGEWWSRRIDAAAQWLAMDSCQEIVRGDLRHAVSALHRRARDVWDDDAV